MYATCFYISYSFLCILLISRYLTHFSISVYHIIVSYTTFTQDLTPDLTQGTSQGTLHRTSHRASQWTSHRTLSQTLRGTLHRTLHGTSPQTSHRTSQGTLHRTSPQTSQPSNIMFEDTVKPLSKPLLMYNIYFCVKNCFLSLINY